ncbi:hypothetical protein [Mycobacterium genavense]|uniref:hypothetical protein n=1 Tax=Mycobacterium genavense TaxID=36812 RepID=UPI000471FDD1|nr:hypothetical protein [Mycobacterium genavense]
MTAFRVIDPHGEIVGAKNFDSAEAAYAWFMDTVADSSELGWRMEVDDGGAWAHFDDIGGFTAPASRRRRNGRMQTPRCS